VKYNNSTTINTIEAVNHNIMSILNFERKYDSLKNEHELKDADLEI
jgi:hypothetical protein